jgi:hypothetical protein
VTTARGSSKDGILSEERDVLARALARAGLPLGRGVVLSAPHGTPISAKYALAGGTLQLSVCTLKTDSFSGDIFSNVIVDVRSGAIATVEVITDAGDAQSQKAAMAGAGRSLEAVTADAVKANAGYRAARAMPSLVRGRPVLEVLLVRGREWKVASEPLD